MAKSHGFIGTVGIALILTIGALVGPGASYASADPNSPGNNGTVKIHDADTAVEDMRNEPHVCRFYVDGFKFDDNSSGQWWIQSWPPTGNGTEVKRESFTGGAKGEWHSGIETLPMGHYKLFAKQQNEATPGGDKQKVFWVDCPPSGVVTQPGAGGPATPNTPAVVVPPAAPPAAPVAVVSAPVVVVINAGATLPVDVTLPTTTAITLSGGTVLPANATITLPFSITLASGATLAAGVIPAGTTLRADTTLPAGTIFTVATVLGVQTPPQSGSPATAVGTLPASLPATSTQDGVPIWPVALWLAAFAVLALLVRARGGQNVA